MHKAKIALAVAALAGASAAMAQSNVTIYGNLDASVGNYTASGGQRITGVKSNGLSESRLGFKGSEDLGNGLKAVFTLEAGPLNFGDTNGSAATGNGLADTRQAFVGLTGGFGTVVAGQLQTPALDWAYKYSALGGASFDPLHNVAAGFGINAKDRVPNAVAYVSPTVNGFTGKLAYASNNAPTSDVRLGAVVASVDYDRGPLSVGAVYREVNTDAGQKEFALGATYDLQVVKLGATAQTLRANADAAPRYNAYSLSANVPVGAKGHVIGELARSLELGADNSVNAGTVAYVHDLSKRTSLYGGYTRVNAQGTVQPALAGIVGDAGGHATGFYTGMRHSF